MRRFGFVFLLSLLLSAPLSCGRGEEIRPVPRGLPRIISLAPSITDILVAVGASRQIAGICAPAPETGDLARLPVAASFGMVNLERVVALCPSFCATVRGMQDPRAISDLRRLGVEVREYPVDTMAQLWSCMEDLGRRAGWASEGLRLAKASERRVAEVRASAGGGRVRAAVLLSVEPAVAAGEMTMIAEVLHAAGFSNALAPLRGYPQVDMETLASAKPQVLVFPEGDLPEGAAEGMALALGRILGRAPTLAGIPADLLVRPGPGTPEAVERLAAVRRGLTSKTEAPPVLFPNAGGVP